MVKATVALLDEMVERAARATRGEPFGELALELRAVRVREAERGPHPPAHEIEPVRACAPQRLRALPRLVVVHRARRRWFLALNAERARERGARARAVARDSRVDIVRRPNVESASDQAQHVHSPAHFFFFFCFFLFFAFFASLFFASLFFSFFASLFFCFALFFLFGVSARPSSKENKQTKNTKTQKQKNKKTKKQKTKKQKTKNKKQKDTTQNKKGKTETKKIRKCWFTCGGRWRNTPRTRSTMRYLKRRRSARCAAWSWTRTTCGPATRGFRSCACATRRTTRSLTTRAPLVSYARTPGCATSSSWRAKKRHRTNFFLFSFFCFHFLFSFFFVSFFRFFFLFFFVSFFFLCAVGRGKKKRVLPRTKNQKRKSKKKKEKRKKPKEKMKGELKELLFAQLQALSRAYQSAVSIMSAYEREFERVEKELNDERAERAKDRGEIEALKKERDELREIVASHEKEEEDDDPLSVV
jgi:flagellar biosynthesis GTPase FlhF